jgi:hypothetical protein
MVPLEYILWVTLSLQISQSRKLTNFTTINSLQRLITMRVILT